MIFTPEELDEIFDPKFVQKVFQNQGQSEEAKTKAEVKSVRNTEVPRRKLELESK